MAEVRNELHDYPITHHRKKAILTGVGVSVWRAMKSGAVKAGRQLAAFVHEIIHRLREAYRIGDGVRSWCSWAGYSVHEAIELQRAKHASDESSAQLIAQIRREKEEAKGSVDAFLSEVGVGNLGDYVRELVNA